MEVAVIQFDGITGSTFIFVNHELVVEAKFAFWSAREVRPHKDVTVDVRT